MTDIAAINQVVITGKDDSGAAFASASARLTEFGNLAAKTVGGLQGVFATLGVGTFIGTIESAISLQAELGRLADRAGMTVEALSAMRLAAHEGGVSLEEVATGSARLSKAVFEALDGTSKAAKALELLGLDAKALNLLGPAEQMKELATRLSQFQDGGAKTAVIMELLGKSGAQFQAFLKALAQDGGTAALITTEQANAAREAEAAFARLADNSTKLKIVLANDLLPAIVEITNALVAIGEAATVISKASALLTSDLNLLGRAFKFLFGPEIAIAMAVFGIQAEKSGESTRVWGGEMNRARDSLASLGAAAGEATFDMAKLDAVIASIESKDLGIGGGFASAFAELTKGVNAGKLSLEQYQALTKQLLNQQPWQEKAAAAARQLADAQQRVIDKQIEYLAKLDDEVQTFGMSEYALAKYRAEQEGVAAAAADSIEQILRNKDALNQLKQQLDATAKAWQDYDAAEKRLKDAAAAYIDSLFAQNEQLTIELATLGMSSIASQQYVLDMQLKKAATEGNTTAVAALTKSLDLLNQISAKTDAQKAQNEALHQQISDWQELERIGQDAFQHIGEKGHNVLADLGADLKKYLLDMLYQLTLKKWIISIATSVSGGGVGAALANQGSNNPLGLLGGIGNWLSGLFGGAPAGGGGYGMNDRGLGTSDLAGLGGLSGLIPGLSALGPLVPLLGLAIPLLSGLFSKTPSDVKGQFGVSSGTTGFEDNAFTSNQFGNLGFLDANTQQFSGQAAQVFNKIVSGALDAFAARMTTEGKARLSDILKNTVFASFEGTFTTEDFLQKYGGQVLQQVATAAFSVLDPALGSVEAAFTGTADEVATFTNTLLSIYDASKGFSDTFKANIVGALGDSTQATADKVLAFVQIVGLFGTGLDPISTTLQGLSSTDIPAFIDALGGASSALTQMTFLFNNFYTTGQRLTQSTAQLNEDFASLGITAIPQTHQAFLDLLNSFDLTTDAGRQMYASVLSLAPLFVTVHGTADQAAGSIDNLSGALSQAAQSAQDFFNTNFYSDAEKQAKQYAADTKQIADAQKALGITIPTTVAGFRQLIEGIDQTTPAGKALYAALIVLAPAIYDVSGAATTAATNLAAAADTINNIAYPDTASAAQKFIDKFLGQIKSLADKSTGDFGDKAGIEIPLVQAQIEKINAQIAAAWQASGGVFNTTIETLEQEKDGLVGFNVDLTAQLAQFTVLKAQYGSAIAQQLIDLQAWYDNQTHVLRGNAGALAALQVIFKQNWDAIIAGTSTGVTGTIDQLDRLRKAILDYANGLSLGNLSPLSPQSKLAEAAKQYQDELAKAQSGDQGALGDITKFADTYLNLAKQNFASSSQYTDIFTAVQNALQNLGTPPQIISDATLPGADPRGAGSPTTVVTSGGASVATDGSVEDVKAQVMALIAELQNTSRAEREALIASSGLTRDQIVTAVGAGAAGIVAALGARRRR